MTDSDGTRLGAIWRVWLRLANVWLSWAEYATPPNLDGDPQVPPSLPIPQHQQLSIAAQTSHSSVMLLRAPSSVST
jgi:hypothetical protein